MSQALSISLPLLTRKSVHDELAACNEAGSRHGIVLTEEQMADLIRNRNEALKATGRVEFGPGITPLLIESFGDSPHIQNDTIERSLEELQDIFYHRKSDADETEGISDEDLARALRIAFDETAQGSTALLEEVTIEALQRIVDRSTAGDDDQATDCGLEEEHHDEATTRHQSSRDALDRVYEAARRERPDNAYARSFYEDHDELQRSEYDIDGRIGGSRLL